MAHGFQPLRAVPGFSSLRLCRRYLTEFRKQNRNLAFGQGVTVFLTPEEEIKYSRLQQRTQILSSLFSTVMNRYEVARLEAKREISSIEVLNYAEPPESVLKPNITRPMLLSSAMGFMVSVFLAFFLEYVERGRQSGRMDPILKHLQRDVAQMKRLFGAGSQRKANR